MKPTAPLNRRRFMALAASILGLFSLPGPVRAEKQLAPGASCEENPASLRAGQWGMVIDTRKLADPARLEAIIRACHRPHNVPDIPPPRDIKWIWHEDLEGAFPEMAGEYLPGPARERRYPLLCNHCSNPPCARVCPTGATFRREDGIVIMDCHRCIGCRYCMAACPYGARSFNYDPPRPFLSRPVPEYPTRTRGVVEKCTFCVERLAVGQPPWCVQASAGAIVFGDLLDPRSAVRRLLDRELSIRRKPSLGTGANVFYIL